jgi:hypothetical protein
VQWLRQKNGQMGEQMPRNAIKNSVDVLVLNVGLPRLLTPMAMAMNCT